MGYGFACFTIESYELLKRLNREKVLSDENYRRLEDCRNFREVEAVLKAYCGIDDHLDREIPYFIRKSIIRWKKGERKNSKYLHDRDWQFLFEVLNNRGVISEESITKMFTYAQINPIKKKLDGYGIISNIQVKNGKKLKTIFLINQRLISNIKTKK